MALKLVCFASYLTNPEKGWRDEDHNTLKFIKALKGNREFKGYATIPVGRSRKRLEMSNRQDAYRWFGMMASGHLSAQLQAMAGPVHLVPLPSSEGVLGATITRFPAREMATQLQAAVGGNTVVTDILRWREPKPSASSSGGTRNANVLRENLVVTVVPAQGTCILVDDVCTSGGHLLAAAAALEIMAAPTVEMAICAGRTCKEQPSNPWSVHTEDLGVSDDDFSDFF